MKKMKHVVLCCVLAAASTGCAEKGYLADRGRDALDVFTLTIGPGLGAGARVGPLHAGLGVQIDMVGMRGGAVDVWEIGHGMSVTIETTVYSTDRFPYGESRQPEERNKTFEAFGYPLISYIPQKTVGTGEKAVEQHTSYSYYTQIEAFAGAIGGLRVGFNPGELIDFLLGWTTLDIYNDDLGARQ